MGIWSESLSVTNAVPFPRDLGTCFPSYPPWLSLACLLCLLLHGTPLLLYMSLDWRLLCRCRTTGFVRCLVIFFFFCIIHARCSKLVMELNRKLHLWVEDVYYQRHFFTKWGNYIKKTYTLNITKPISPGVLCWESIFIVFISVNSVVREFLCIKSIT